MNKQPNNELTKYTDEVLNLAFELCWSAVYTTIATHEGETLQFDTFTQTLESALKDEVKMHQLLTQAQAITRA